MLRNACNKTHPVITATMENGSIKPDEALRAMNSGSEMIKHWSRSGHGNRTLILTKDFLQLHINKTTCSGKSTKIIDLKKVEEVRTGHKSPLWIKMEQSAPDKDCCFSLAVEGRTDAIHFQTLNKQTCQLWVKGIQHLSERLEDMNMQEKQMLWVKKKFKMADKDSNGKLSLKEIKRLLKKINVEMDESHVENLFKKTDKSADGFLSESEFMHFFKTLSWRPEIERIFKNFCDRDFKIDSKELQRFFREEMDNAVSIEIAAEYIQTYEPNSAYRDSGFLSYYGFLYLLLSPHGNIFNEKCSKVYQDMSQPLSHYYIASSHNTYLVNHQLYGESSVESYVRALERGCRCLELDCWDGEDGEPIIYHGYTLVSKIKFQFALTAINEYAFKQSDYPVILSIENHCSIPQQTKMAKYMKEIFGAKLLTMPISSDETELPSPEQLKGKVLVKGKKLKQSSLDAETDDEVTDEDEAADLEDEEVKNKSKTSKKSKIKLSPELSSCVVYVQSKRFVGFNDVSSTFVHISSLNEDKAEELCFNQCREFIDRNKNQLIRIYPKGTRTDSSNYSPINFWNNGCQIVALNYQTTNKAIHHYISKFRDNGGCGYILKPLMLRDESNFTPNNTSKVKMNITIRVISAQQLPKPKGSTKGEVVDPFVKISVNGCNIDKKSARTSVVENNGFNPTWKDEEFVFKICEPELALITISVFDADGSKKQKIGAYTVGASCLATGYRHVHLEDLNGNSLSPASVFVKIFRNKLD